MLSDTCMQCMVNTIQYNIHPRMNIVITYKQPGIHDSMAGCICCSQKRCKIMLTVRITVLKLSEAGHPYRIIVTHAVLLSRYMQFAVCMHAWLTCGKTPQGIQVSFFTQYSIYTLWVISALIIVKVFLFFRLFFLFFFLHNSSENIFMQKHQEKNLHCQCYCNWLPGILLASYYYS